MDGWVDWSGGGVTKKMARGREDRPESDGGWLGPRKIFESTHMRDTCTSYVFTYLHVPLARSTPTTDPDHDAAIDSIYL